MNNLTSEERAILRSYNRGEWRQVKNMKKEIKRHMSYARATVRAQKNVNVKISVMDYQGLRELASIQRIPYKVLMASIIHQYLENRATTRRGLGNRH